MTEKEKTVALTDTCDHCGRPYQKGRLTTRKLFRDFVETTFSFDQGFFHTFIVLLDKPMKVVNHYIEGKRKPFTTPFRFLVVSVTLYVLAYYLMPLDKLAVFKIKSDSQIFLQHFYELYQRLVNLALFSVIPLVAFITYVFGNRKKYNYAENLVANAYIQGAFNLVGVVISLIAYALLLADARWGLSLSALSFIVLARGYYALFTGNRFLRVLKTLFTMTWMILVMALFAWLVVMYLVEYGDLPLPENQ